MSYFGSDPVILALRNLFVATIRQKDLSREFECLLKAWGTSAPHRGAHRGGHVIASLALLPQDPAEFMERVDAVPAVEVCLPAPASAPASVCGSGWRVA